MTLNFLPIIKLEPIKTISPSKYFSLKSCKLKGILSENKFRSLIPSSPSAKVGLIAHKILEMAIKGQIQNEHAMELSWQSICENIEGKMKNNPLEKHMVPLELFAYNFEVKKNMVFAIVRKLMKKEPIPFAVERVQKQEAEKWYKTSDGKIAGIVDLIRYTDLGLELVDYKTGSVTDPAENNVPKLEYQQQLKLYAALYYSVEKVWPTRLVLLELDQKEHVVEFNKNECLELLDSAKRDLEEINKNIASRFNPEDFSSPSPESCKYCGYRPICNAYWKKKQDNDKWPIDVIGEIKEKRTLGNSLLKIVLETDQKTIAIRSLSPQRNSFLQENVKRVMFCNLSNDSKEAFYFENLLTVGYPLS